MNRARAACCLAIALLLPGPSATAAEDAATHAGRLFDSLATQPARLRMLLREMPKGADLHNHLSGAIYAESYLGWARQAGLCLDPATHALGPAPCRAPMVPADPALAHTAGLNDSEIDALSMRDFEPTQADRSGHDHFFSTFGKFDAAGKGRAGEMLAEAANRAAADHVIYLEIMHYPLMRESAALGLAHPWHGEDFAHDLDEIRPALPALVREARIRTSQAEARMRTVLHCGTPQAQPGCAVRIRYLTQVLRAMPPPEVFAQMAYSYALVEGDPRFLGVNIVEPEDDPVALRDYDLHMRAFRYLSSVWPKVPLTLHAGELTEGLVPTADLQFHIRHAVEIAGAKRIGHGVDVTYEDDAPGLLAEMAQRHVAVEINLTSNAQILGVSGDEHPFEVYRAAGVPMALSTDDEGVERIDLTHEYLRATTTYHLHYADLKQLSRNSLTYSFLPGASLWNVADGRLTGACAGTTPGTPATGGCGNFLAHDEKARVQWQLEAAFTGFEQGLLRQRF
ncbi:adenosine deaminase family protein [Lichenicoccus roseus]|uniref:adenosine deaminase n=1 Tax=Lichenicoccus roseus TaxID=2683649 RepID=A0A5R9J5L7_9PROT|nr:adenosine deaminase [Lichenicoccus roseus]TLU72920.1 adenosine deaminase [Lichenicoccus roseus]